MKLIDILARELKEWPAKCTAGYCCQSDSTSEVYFGGDAENIFLSERAEETCGVQVTRAEWQAAVDALNKPAAPEWNGEGLPPVGAECEWRDDDNGSWEKVRICYLSQHTALLAFVTSAGDFEGAYSPKDCQFRPIRTPEQIAAEEREKAISKMAVTALDGDSDLIIKKWLERLYDAGYRKQEAP